ncbi:MAG: cyclic nucleotide-binding domain-containing protein [Anaerolineae bacterium]|nr:cyclic nucleotide-binding domain-containing protein [Anaerolineae bacterium]MCX8066495.1 cyclic nucleotide-binding domain-containing protein [Anaerolineae bacterium]MDW7991117.1 cyclic nucleotide-binding domain-containing protein [Anaerolineae bacterium]
MEELTQLLKRSDLFCDLADEDIGCLVAVGHWETYRAGETIIREGDPSDALYIIQKGMVEVTVPQGTVPDIPGPPEPQPVVRLGEGQMFGEMGLVDQGRRSATVRALVDGTTVFVLPRDAFLNLCESRHSIGYIMMRNIARDLSFKLRHRNLRMAAGW